MSRRHRAWPRELALWLLVALAVFAIARVHYAGQTLARGPDQADMLLAFFNEASHAAAEEGVLAAMYTEGVRAGEANWSNPNYHMLYPLYFNWAGADASPAATLDRLNLIILLHLALLGAGGFALARALGVPRWPALAVGLLLPWFPAVRSAAAWPHIIAGMAWLPWLLAAQVRLQAPAGTALRAWLGAGLALAATLLVYAHPAQNLVFAAWSSAWLWLLPGIALLRSNDAGARRAFAGGAATVALAAGAVLLASWPYLSEILAFHARSIRWLGEIGGHVTGNMPVPVDALRHHALAAGEADRYAVFAIRRGIGHPYVGAALLVAALLVAGRWLPAAAGTRAARALLAVAVFALAACLAPMAPLMAVLPLANKVRELTWWACLATVLLLPLAALGLHALRARVAPPATRDGWLLLAALAFAATAVATAAAAGEHRAAALLALAVAFAALGWRLRRGNAAPAVAAVLACMLVLGASAWMPFRHNLRFAHDDAMLFHADRRQAHADAAALAARLPERSLYRFRIDAAMPDAHLLTHAWTLHGFRALHGGIGPDDHAKYRLLHEGGAMVRALYGERWTLLPEASAVDGDQRLRPGLVLRTDPQALPRLYFLAGALTVVDDPAAALRESRDPSPLQALAAAGDLPSALPGALRTGGAPERGEVELRRNARTSLDAVVDPARPGILVLNEDPAARWRATVDGREVPVFRVNGFQSAVAIDAPGRHEVRIRRPGRLWGGGDAEPAPR